MTTNAFFDAAMHRAGAVLGKRQRLIALAGRLAVKLKDIRWNEVSQQGVREKFETIVRMFRAYVSGRYTAIPWKSILLITATIIYIVNPFDLIPDMLLGIGFTDDFGLLLMAYNSLHEELEKFITWEKSQVIEL
ncbi:MAG TPA: DUF1232 domain-containing protein [Ohtaekwangia sp.]|nr:DUF1232 domain-containing protein [Ohtaekwangia sp.]